MVFFVYVTYEATFISKQNISVLSLRRATPSSLKNRGDVFQSWLFLFAEFSHGSFHTLEALSSFDNKRRQNGIFFCFNLAFFLTWIWYPDTPVMSSAAQAEATESVCRHMDSSSNLVCDSIIKLGNSTGHLTHQCYVAQRLLSGTDDHLEFPALVTGCW